MKKTQKFREEQKSIFISEVQIEQMPVFIQEYTSNDFDKTTSPTSLFLLSELQFFIIHGCILSGLNSLKIMSHNK